MTDVILLPVWQLVTIVAATAITSAIPSAYFAAKRGARMAIEVCARNWDCKMAQAGPKAVDTQDLEKQLAKLRAAHPEIARARKAMEKADTGETPVRTRAQQDKDIEGHKG